ncbi:MAG: sugar nucleotide-binding protein [Blastochloris sp.]|nr:sugar nucleotide-binding protein [Blastochloris sp.]
MKILLLGAKGLMGRYLTEHWQREGVAVTGLSRAELDICDSETSLHFLDHVNPTHVINAAALCRMEECELAPETSRAINTHAPAWWSQACAERGLNFVHMSTDYVFGGGVCVPYTEEDIPKPLSVYAQHKCEGEAAVLRNATSTVVRLAWVFGSEGKTFMSMIPHLLQEQDVLEVAMGRTGGCLYAGYGATMISDLILSNGVGLYHLTHHGVVTWQDFALECKKQMLQRGLPIKSQEIRPASLDTYRALQAKRPDYSVLSTKKIERVVGKSILPWQDGLNSYLEELFKSN